MDNENYNYNTLISLTEYTESSRTYGIRFLKNDRTFRFKISTTYALADNTGYISKDYPLSLHKGYRAVRADVRKASDDLRLHDKQRQASVLNPIYSVSFEITNLLKENSEPITMKITSGSLENLYESVYSQLNADTEKAAAMKKAIGVTEDPVLLLCKSIAHQEFSEKKVQEESLARNNINTTTR